MLRRRHSDSISSREQTRAMEVLCAVNKATSESTNLPSLEDVSRSVGFDATETLVTLIYKKLIKEWNGFKWFSLTHAGENAVTSYCRSDS